MISHPVRPFLLDPLVSMTKRLSSVFCMRLTYSRFDKVITNFVSRDRDDQQAERQMDLVKLASGWKGPHLIGQKDICHNWSSLKPIKEQGKIFGKNKVRRPQEALSMQRRLSYTQCKL